MKTFFKAYYPASVLGFLAGLFFIFVPSLIFHLGVVVEYISDFVFQNNFFKSSYLGLLIRFFILCLPFFLIYLLTPMFRNRAKAKNKKKIFLFLSLVFFSAGVLFSYALFIIMAVVAVSQSNLVW